MVLAVCVVLSAAFLPDPKTKIESSAALVGSYGFDSSSFVTTDQLPKLARLLASCMFFSQLDLAACCSVLFSAVGVFAFLPGFLRAAGVSGEPQQSLIGAQ